MKINMAVFFGCRSVEHEVSIISAVQAMHAVNKDKYAIIPIYVAKNGEMYTGKTLFNIEEYRNMPELLKKSSPVTCIKKDERVYLRYLDNTIFSKKKDEIIDVAFPIVHGTNSEDGTMAGYFEFLGLPYISCDILSAAVGMNKAVFKDVLSAAGLPVLPCVRFTAKEYVGAKDTVIDKIIEKYGLPVIVKPVNLGSSIGISKADTREALAAAIDLAISFSDIVIAEAAITSLREINCSVIGDLDSCVASVCEEPFMKDEILSYADKYENSGKQSGMASLGRKLPADLPEEMSEEIRIISCKIFKALGCSGVVRIDYLIDTKINRVFANEINTIPGSLSFYLWEATGLKYTDMIDKLVEIAFRRSRSRENLTYTISTNILAGVSFGAKGSKGSKL